MKKILCATDGTEHSAHAVELAAEMAKKLGASLSICVVNVAHGGSRGPLIYTMEDDQVKKVLDSAAAVARKMGVASVDELALRRIEVGDGVVGVLQDPVEDVDLHMIVEVWW